jgi:alkylation response protein AidB-like acyl-CoA dehydrogenase
MVFRTLRFTAHLLNHIHTPKLVITQELCHIGARGYGDALLAGSVIGLPPILNFGSEELQKKIVPEVFQAKKFICLAVSEPFAGLYIPFISFDEYLIEGEYKQDRMWVG